MKTIPPDAPPAAVVHAIEANEDARFAYLSRLPGSAFHRGSRLTWFLTGMPYLLFNGVLSARLPPDDLDRRIPRALAPFAARTLPMFWMTGPSTQPADLGQRLLAAGLSDAGPLVGMAADLASVQEDGSTPPAALRIARVRDLSTLQPLGPTAATVRLSVLPAEAWTSVWRTDERGPETHCGDRQAGSGGSAHALGEVPGAA